MRSLPTKIYALSFCLLLSACGDDNFKKYVELGELRVLGLVASSPEVNPGVNVTITPWISHVNNTGTLRFSWQACVDPGISFGATPSCEGNPTATTIQSADVTILGAGDTFTGAADGFTVAVPGTILLGRSATDSYNGVNFLVIYKLTDSTGKAVTAFKRIVVTEATKTPKNQNPTITDVLADGLVFSSLSAATKYNLSSQLSNPEAYSQKRTDGSLVARVETLQSTWFYTEGEVKYYRTLNTETNDYTTPQSFPVGRASFVILSVRDGRGGQSFRKKIVNP
jgi:hypothetical protein